MNAYLPAPRRPCGCTMTGNVIWDAGAGTGTYCPTCRQSLSRPPADTSWITMETIGADSGFTWRIAEVLAALGGVAFAADSAGIASRYDEGAGPAYLLAGAVFCLMAAFVATLAWTEAR